MASTPPTRTIGPLHLEDLEPHRFEDLVRQLCYDFRNWLRLEATGRSGADDGFDVRGVETPSFEPPAEFTDEEAPTPVERVWLIQCKREKAIAAKKIASYMDALKPAVEGVYGIIFVAACDFSKATRDAFFAKARDLGLSEAHLWGKAEIEDMLFQPRNDHLLFAYFGVSLLSRRRGVTAEIRSRLAAKRKAKRLLEDGQKVLIREATDDGYPYLDSDETRDRLDRGHWRVLEFIGCFSDGLHFRIRRHFAWIGADGVAWDFDETMNDAVLHPHDDPWQDEDSDRFVKRHKSMEFWNSLPEAERAWFEVDAVLPYDAIIDIDEHGDEYVSQPHVLTVEFNPEMRGPFSGFRAELRTARNFDARYAEPELATRVRKFPKEGIKEDRDHAVTSVEAAAPEHTEESG